MCSRGTFYDSKYVWDFKERYILRESISGLKMDLLQVNEYRFLDRAFKIFQKILFLSWAFHCEYDSSR